MPLPIRAVATRFDPRRVGSLGLWVDFSDASTVTLKHQHTSSTAVNRIISPWGGDVVLASGGTAGHGSVVLVYDQTDSRWRVV